MASSSKRARSSSSGANVRTKSTFEKPEVRVFHDAECKGKRIVVETTLDKPEALRWGDLVDPIAHNNWRYFTEDMDYKLSRSLVWEFFAHAHYREVQSPGCRKSWVRGVEISYDAEAIASVLGLPFYPENTDFVDYYNRSNIDNDDFDVLKNALFLAGKDWNYGRNQSVKHVYAKHLTATSRFWTHFVCHNLYPQSHETECKPHILRVVYGIRQLFQVDAAWLMSTYLFHMAREDKPGSFGLPWVIHKLCHAAGVFFGDDFRDLLRTPRMTIKSWEAYDSIAVRMREEVPAPAPEPAPIPPLAPAAHDGAMDAVTQQLEKLLRRQRRQMRALRMENQMHQRRDDELRAHGYQIPHYTPEQLQLFYNTSSSDDMQDGGADSS